MFVPKALSYISPSPALWFLNLGDTEWGAAKAPAKGEREVNTLAVLCRGLPEIRGEAQGGDPFFPRA